MRPYRLVNSIELLELNQFFQEKLDQWNEEYCLHPLKMHLALAPKNHQCTHPLLLGDLILMEEDYTHLINESLFGVDQAIFDDAGKGLFLRLLSHFLDRTYDELSPGMTQTPDWFYAGSTCLSLEITCQEKAIQLFLNPAWVYQKLPKSSVKSSELHSLDEALSEHRITLSLELIPSTLSVKHIANMQVGDVLSTNHPLSAALNLLHGTELIAQAGLGTSSHHKTIVLKESS